MDAKSRLVSPPSSSGKEESDKSHTGKETKDSFLSRRKRWIKKKVETNRQSGDASRPPERFTYEHMLLRYGDWRSIRSQIIAYTVLMIATLFHKAHGDLLFVVARLDTISVGRHIHCCCELQENAEYAKRMGEMFAVDDISQYVVLGCAALFSLSCPLWERHIGRRNLLAAACALGAVISICSCFKMAEWLVMAGQIAFAVSNVSVFIISISTLSEILPYNVRYMAPATYTCSICICNAIAVINFRTGLIEKPFFTGIASAMFYVVGAFVVAFYVRDSIIHLVNRNLTDKVEKMIKKKEMQLFKREPQGDKQFHRKIAMLIFHDLVYLDRDEPRIGKFLKSIYKNWAMTEIVLAFFQSISAGAIEYEFNHFWEVQFADLYFVNGIKVTGYMLGGFFMYYTRKTHRIKALQWLFTASLLATSICHVVVSPDRRNLCSSDIHHHFPLERYQLFAAILGALTTGLGSALQMQILLHFLETTPSILRPICVMMVYMPIKAARQLCRMIFRAEGVETTASLVPVYLYHLVIIAITMWRSRTRDKLQFSLHLFDLMPHIKTGNQVLQKHLIIVDFLLHSVLELVEQLLFFLLFLRLLGSVRHHLADLPFQPTERRAVSVDCRFEKSEGSFELAALGHVLSGVVDGID